MNEEIPQSKKSRLALAIAQGQSISAWARANSVPQRTAFRWAGDPKVRRAVESWRRRSLDRAIGRMAGRATWAADGIARLAESAESESVQLRARRALLSDQMAVAKYADLERRMTEIEDQLHEQTGQPDSAS